MTRPGTGAAALAAALVLGACLGLWYALLGILRLRWKNLADGLFVAGLFAAWVYLGFGICGGDLRFFQSLGLLLGAGAFQLTVGRPLTGVLTGAFHRIRQKFSGRIELISHFFKKT